MARLSPGSSVLAGGGKRRVPLIQVDTTCASWERPAAVEPPSWRRYTPYFGFNRMSFSPDSVKIYILPQMCGQKIEKGGKHAYF